MATYIQGVTDYIPQIQPFRPDFNFYQNVLARKQYKYDQGWSKVNSLYNSLLNAPMLRAEDIEKRDDFFKRAQFEIKRLSGVDLSNPTNIDAAYKLFKPYYTDKNIIHDMRETKAAMNNYQKGESLRHETDAKKGAGQFWQGGLDYINLWRKKYSESSNQAALTMSAPPFVPKFDLRGFMNDDITENGYEMIRESAPGSPIKMKYKNGAMMVPDLVTYYDGYFANNPQAQAYYGVKAELHKYNWMQENQSQHQTEDAAEDAYVTDILSNIIKSQSNVQENVTKDKQVVNHISDTYKEYAEKYGGTPYLEEIQGKLQAQSDALNNTQQSVTNTNLVLSNGEKMDITKYRGRSDQLSSTLMMRQDILSAATAYANLTSEETWEYDPLYLAQQKSNINFEEYKRKALFDFRLDALTAIDKKAGEWWQNQVGLGEYEGGSVEGNSTQLENLKRIQEGTFRQEQLINDAGYSFIKSSLLDAQDGTLDSSFLTAFTDVLLQGVNGEQSKNVRKLLANIQRGVQEKGNNLSAKDLKIATEQYINILQKHGKMNKQDIYTLADEVIKDGGKLNGYDYFNLITNEESPLKNWDKNNLLIRTQIEEAKQASQIMLDLEKDNESKTINKMLSAADVTIDDKNLLATARQFDYDGNYSQDFLSKGEFPSEQQFIAAYSAMNSYEMRPSFGPFDEIGRGIGSIKDMVDFNLGIGDPLENLLGASRMISTPADKLTHQLGNISAAKEKYSRLKDKYNIEYAKVASQFGYDAIGSAQYFRPQMYGAVKPDTPNALSNQKFNELYSDFNRLKGDQSALMIHEGGPATSLTSLQAGTLSGANPKVSQGIADMIMKEALHGLVLTDASGAEKSRDNPYITFDYNPRALSSNDWVAFHVKPNAHMLKKFAAGSKDSETAPGSTGPLYNKGIWEDLSGFTVYMKRDRVQNSLQVNSHVSDKDMILQNGGSISLNQFPSAGKMSFKINDKGTLTSSYFFKGFELVGDKIIEKAPLTDIIDIGPYMGIDSEQAVNQSLYYLQRLSAFNRQMVNIQTALKNKKITLREAKVLLGMSPQFSSQDVIQNPTSMPSLAEDYLLGN